MVHGDAGFGDLGLMAALAVAELAYCLGVRGNFTVYLPEEGMPQPPPQPAYCGRGRPPKAPQLQRPLHTVDQVRQALEPTAWQRVAYRQATTGLLQREFVAQRVQPANKGACGSEMWLLLERPLDPTKAVPDHCAGGGLVGGTGPPGPHPAAHRARELRKRQGRGRPGRLPGAVLARPTPASRHGLASHDLVGPSPASAAARQSPANAPRPCRPHRNDGRCRLGAGHRDHPAAHRAVIAQPIDVVRPRHSRARCRHRPAGSTHATSSSVGESAKCARSPPRVVWDRRHPGAIPAQPLPGLAGVRAWNCTMIQTRGQY